MKKLKKITEKVLLDAVKACADHYMRTELKTGRGFPDCLVRYQGLTFFVELKTPTDKISKLQNKFISDFEPGMILGVNKMRHVFAIIDTNSAKDEEILGSFASKFEAYLVHNVLIIA